MVKTWVFLPVFMLCLGLYIPPLSAHTQEGGVTGAAGGAQTESGAGSAGGGSGQAIDVTYQQSALSEVKGLTRERINKEKNPERIDRNIRGAIRFMMQNPVAGNKNTVKNKQLDRLPDDLKAFRDLLTLYHCGSDGLEKMRKKEGGQANLVTMQLLMFHFILNGKR